MKNTLLAFTLYAVTALTAFAAPAVSGSSSAPAVTRVPVVFSGGHETDGRDGGRPVVLVAAGLGVPTEMFREAFSHVHPAGPGKQPDEKLARDNKSALMNALGKYGVTNDRLDTVSNYYRYVRSRGELWTVKPAVANALVQNGVITGFEIVSAGAGYSSPPTVTVSNMPAAKVEVKLAFGKELDKNGSISALTIAAAKAK